MNENTSFDNTKRQTINPIIDEMNKEVEPLFKKAMNELEYEIPLYVRLYNQIRFYEEYGKLKMGTSVASKKTLAEQFGVTVEQIERAYSNLTHRYKLGLWVDHQEPVFRNVTRTWMSNARLKEVTNSYSGRVQLLQRKSSTLTVEELPTDTPPLSESKKKISRKKPTNVGLSASRFGDRKISSIIDQWNDVVGLPLRNINKQRYAVNALLKRFEYKEVIALIDIISKAHSDKYSGKASCSDLIELEQNANAVMVYAKKNNNGGFVSV